MTTIFRLIIILGMISGLSQAQVQTIFQENFDAKNLETLKLDLNASSVMIEESDDDKVHFDYKISFENYSKKEIEKFLEQINVSSQIIGNELQFETNSENVLGEVVYNLETLYGITFDGDHIVFKERDNREFRKSKHYFLDINDGFRAESLKEYLKNLKGLDGKGNKRKVNLKNVKITKTNFTIRIPKYLNFKIRATNSALRFIDDISSKIELYGKDVNLKSKDLKNPLNNFNLTNGQLRANAIEGGTYKFDNVRTIQCAELKNVSIQSELSYFRIGVIGKDVHINDFNSKFWLHNFSQDFGAFKMTTEYSEINLFYPENMDYLLTTFGHDTIHYHHNLVTEITPSKKDKSTKMMIIGDQTKQHSNTIEIESVHGVIRFGVDFIDFEP